MWIELVCFFYTAEGQQSSTSNTPKTDKNDNLNKTPQNQTPNITGPTGMPNEVIPTQQDNSITNMNNGPFGTMVNGQNPIIENDKSAYKFLKSSDRIFELIELN